MIYSTCRHDVHKLNFNRNTKLSNFSKEEWTTLINLKNRNKSKAKQPTVQRRRDSRLGHRPLPTRSNSATFGRHILHQSLQRPNFRQPKNCQRNDSGRRLCSDESGFNSKFDEMCQSFKNRGYPDSSVTTDKHRALEIDRETALQTPQNEDTLTYHPQNVAVKNVIFKNFKTLRIDPETKHIYPLPPLMSFKRDKNISNFLVRSALKSDKRPGTSKCTRTRCLRTESIR